MRPAIRAENLGKRYRYGERAPYRRFSELLTGLFAARRNRAAATARPSHFWALKDVSFEVPHGQILGIIGSNGAGKTTLLKILSKITEMTEGRVELCGRAGALLEVGTGFHPELTGRENVYLNGAILGMPRAKIRARFDEIVDFSGVEEFLDMPVKHYSSGMQTRLAFAVAAHLEPEILFVDEVLAVGDAQFQKKCLGKMKEVAGAGRTIIFVSHNLESVRRICQIGMLLIDGRIHAHDTIDSVIDTYEGMLAQPPNSLEEQIASLPKDENIRIHSVRIAQGGTPRDRYSNAEPIDITLRCEVLRSHPSLRVFVALHDRHEQLIFISFHDALRPAGEQLAPGPHVFQVSLPGNLLAPMNYLLKIGATMFGFHSCTGSHLVVPLDIRQQGVVDTNRGLAVALGLLWPAIPWTEATKVERP